MRRSPSVASVALTQAAMAGESAALVRLLAATQPDIHRFARRHCRTATDAEDAAQEALWLLSRHVTSLRAAAALPSWLFQVVRRACLRLAHQGFADYVEVDAMADDLRLAHLPAEALRLDVADALASLPMHYRQVVLLRDVQDMPIGEISVALGLSREAVKGRLHRGRALLREHLSS